MEKRICLFETQYSLMVYLLLDRQWDTRQYILTSERISEIAERMRLAGVDVSITPVMQWCNKHLLRYHYLWKKVNKMLRYIIAVWSMTNKQVPVYGQDHIFYARCFFNHDFYLIEDGMMSYQPYEFLQENAREKTFTDQYVTCGWNKYVKKIFFIGRKAIPDGLRNKSEVFNPQERWDELSEKEKSKLLTVLGCDKNKIMGLVNSGRVNILLTQPCYEHDGITIEGHIQGYRKILCNYDMSTVIIKPHPEDVVEYEKIFPECAILRDRFPFELCYFIKIPFKKIISINSTSTMSGLWDAAYIDTYGDMYEKMKEYSR